MTQHYSKQRSSPFDSLTVVIHTHSLGQRIGCQDCADKAKKETFPGLFWGELNQRCSPETETYPYDIVTTDLYEFFVGIEPTSQVSCHIIDDDE